MAERPGEWVVIDLGTAHGSVDEDAPPGPRHRRLATRWRLAAASLALALVCGGAVVAEPPFRTTAAIPVEAGSSVSVAGDLLVVADPVRTEVWDAAALSFAGGVAGGETVEGETILRGYALPDGTPRWERRLPAAMSQSASRAGDLVLVASRDSIRRQTATTAIDARTGALRWRRGDAVMTVPDVPVGLAVEEVRSASGAGRRISGRLDAVRLADGAALWGVDVPSTAVAHVVAGAPPVAVLVFDSGRAEVRDLTTGRLRAAGTLPPADYAPDNPRLVDGGFVLRHPDRGPARRRLALSAYDLGTLGLRWSRPDRTRDVSWVPCGGDLCGRTPEGVWTLRVADGAQVFQAGDRLPWLPVRGSGSQLVVRELADERLAVAAGGTTTAPRALGTLPAGSRDCRLGTGVLVCRGGDGLHLEIFTLPRS